MLDLGLHARRQVGRFFQFSHAIVPDRHKNDARIFYRSLSALLDKFDHAQRPARQDDAWVGGSVMNRQGINRIAILRFCARNKTPVIRINEPQWKRSGHRKGAEFWLRR